MNWEGMLAHWKGGNIHHQEERNNPERKQSMPRMGNEVKGKIYEALSPGAAGLLGGTIPGQ